MESRVTKSIFGIVNCLRLKTEKVSETHTCKTLQAFEFLCGARLIYFILTYYRKVNIYNVGVVSAYKLSYFFNTMLKV